MKKEKLKVEIGKKYGYLTVLEILGPDRTKVCQTRVALCSCDCGGTNTVRLSRLLNDEIKSCGCMKGYKKKIGNKINIKDGYAEIIASNGKVILVDIHNIDKLKEFTWSVNSGRTIEAHTRMDSKLISMHRFIMGFPSYNIDHINRNTLDNRECNLRTATRSQNRQNSISKTGTSMYKGVYKKCNGWAAQIKKTYLGTFETEYEAAIAYDNEAKNLYGEFAYLNFNGVDNNAPTNT